VTKTFSPSPIVGVFVRAVQAKLPATQQEKLKAHRVTIKKTTSAEDGRRARHCARWAIQVAGDKEFPHPEWHKIKELHELWKDLVFGVKFADNLYRQEKAEPVKDVEIEWVEDAVNVAKIVGEQLGWEHALWKDLLLDLIKMEPATP